MPTDENGRGPAVVLRELSGLGREIRLEETTLPERGVAVPVKARLTRTWYPGAAAASVQLFGIEEEPIVFRGWLRDTFLGETNGALSLAQDLRNLLIGQELIELSWGEALVRRGYLTMVRPIFDREADIQYEIEFSPTEADDAVVQTWEAESIPLPSQFTLADVLDLLSDTLELAVTAGTISNGIQAIF